MNKEIDNEQIDSSLPILQSNYETNQKYDHLGQLPTEILKWVDQNSNDLIAIWNHKIEIIYVSRSITSLLEYEPSEVYGKAWEKLISLKELSHSHTCKNGDYVNKIVNLNIYNKHGKKIAFECKIEHVYDEMENVKYFIGLFKDLSHAKESEELMIRSEKMSIAGQLAAGIAHEIRNPLTSLKGFLQLLKAGVNNKETYIQIMSEEIDKIEAITSEFLFISKPLTDKKQVKSVQSMIEDVTLLLNSQANLRNITVINQKKQDYFVFCDGSQIKQVLINIVKNAIEATDASGTVEVIARKSGHSIEIDIIDEGPGISEEALDKISEPFFTTKQGGTGLGLMITKQIIEKHDGYLKIIQNEYKGSTFRIILPEYQES